MPGKTLSVNEWVKRYLKEEEPKSKSLIVSVLGDSIAPHAAGIWLGDLIMLLAPFGISERLVRTSSFRLIDEDWLEARRDGRRSHYSLTPSGAQRIELAYARIYTPPQREWDGSWTLVLMPRNGDPAADRAELRRELEYEGFASPVPGLMVHPAPHHHALRRLIDGLGLPDRVAVLRAHSFDGFPAEPISQLILKCWDLSDVGRRYLSFMERFQPLHATLEQGLTPQQAFVVQTLLIHSFRRATLHDPRLPASLLPPDWPGLGAYALCRRIYQQTYRLARQHLQAASGLDVMAQPSTRPGMQIQQRFGGLQ